MSFVWTEKDFGILKKERKKMIHNRALDLFSKRALVTSTGLAGSLHLLNMHENKPNEQASGG